MRYTSHNCVGRTQTCAILIPTPTAGDCINTYIYLHIAYIYTMGGWVGQNNKKTPRGEQPKGDKTLDTSNLQHTGAWGRVFSQKSRTPHDLQRISVCPGSPGLRWLCSLRFERRPRGGRVPCNLLARSLGLHPARRAWHPL